MLKIYLSEIICCNSKIAKIDMWQTNVKLIVVPRFLSYLTANAFLFTFLFICGYENSRLYLIGNQGIKRPNVTYVHYIKETIHFTVSVASVGPYDINVLLTVELNPTQDGTFSGSSHSSLKSVTHKVSQWRGRLHFLT